ncbi:MAG: hypothetical protein EA357_07025 [Micavibrio sp.]|nr:MAG: hypothetical protein EA357_07025 [Micavibrio sp.]
MKRSANHFLLSGLFCLLACVAAYGAGFLPVSVSDARQPTALTSGYNHNENSIIRLTPNESRILHLNRNATGVIVTNPAHAGVFLDTPRILVIVPGRPGATSFTVLDRDGQEIMRRDVIVSERQNKYVRVQRICAGVSGCVPSSVYYCPDGCHEVSMVGRDRGTVSVSPRPSVAAHQDDDGFDDGDYE